MPKSKTASQRIKAKDRQIQALELRRKGLTYRQIASHMNTSLSTIGKDLKNAMDELASVVDQKARNIRALETERMQTMIFYSLPQAQNGDEKAISNIVKISARIAAMWGLDSIPEQAQEKEKDPDKLNIRELVREIEKALKRADA